MSALELLGGRIPASWSMMLLDGAVKGFLVLAIAAMVATMLRHRSSAVRHLVWTLGVLALLLMPMISWLVPAVDVPVPMRWATPRVSADEVAHVRPMPGTATVVEVAPVISATSAHAPHGAGHASQSVHITGRVKVVTPAAPVQRLRVTAVPSRHDVVITHGGARHSSNVAVAHSSGSNAHDVIVTTPSSPGSAWSLPFGLPAPFAGWSLSSLSVPGLLFGVWLIGALIALAWMLVQQVRLFAIESRAQPIIGGRCARMVDDIAWELGIDKDIVLLAGRDDAMPMTWGVFRPVLLLPATAMVWSRERLSMVLRHELAHVARRDAASQAIAELACALHWYNPLVWLAASRMRVEREHACDDLVLESGPRASDYATELLDIARTLMVRPGVDRAAIAMARRSELKQRLSAVLDEDRPRTRPTGGVLAAALLSAMGIVFPLAALEPAPLHARDSHRPASVAMADVTPAPLAVPAVIAVPLNIKVRQTPVCRRGESGSATTNRNNDNWRIQWEGDNCRVDIRIDGEIRYDAMFTEITAIAPGGRVQLEQQGSRGDRRLVIRPVPQGLAMEWQLNGEDAPFDAAAREWYGLLLQEIARTTGIGADERAAAILERHGTAALMREIDELRSDRVRARYYRALLLSDRLDNSERIAGVIEAAADINSDRELSSLLSELTDRVAASPDLRSAVLSSASGISSDREKVRLYLDLVNASTLTDAQKADVLASSRTVHSDRERNRLLAAVAAQSLNSSELHASYIDATRDMSSDREKSEAFGRILEAGSLNGDQLVALFDAAQTIHSDRELARLLVTALETQDVQGPAREAFVRAMDNIRSEREHGRVASLLSREGR